jgi:hypothetical protein
MPVTTIEAPSTPHAPRARILLHSPLTVWAPFASNVYHDMVWFQAIGQSRIREFMQTGWRQLLRRY